MPILRIGIYNSIALTHRYIYRERERERERGEREIRKKKKKKTLFGHFDQSQKCSVFSFVQYRYTHKNGTDEHTQSI